MGPGTLETGTTIPNVPMRAVEVMLCQPIALPYNFPQAYFQHFRQPLGIVFERPKEGQVGGYLECPLPKLAL